MNEKWWMGKVAYQIWPKSFVDSNDDGIGDLGGIIGKLDYLKELGVDIIWISPVYKSPLVDQGYDISDYYDINPLFGDMDTMDRLLAEAKKRDMYIIMDLVVNHCSDEHEWFQKAMKDPDGEYGKYFYIAEKKDGKLPCNWRSYFGGSVWEPIPGTDKYYLHSFHKKQPDLNWENPAVRQEVYKMMNFWLERGVAGFRIDAIINIKKKLPFRDYEPDRADGLCDIGKMLAEAEGIGTFLEEMKRETFAKYDAFSVGEVFNDKESEIREYIGEDGHFSSKFDFSPELCGKNGRWDLNEDVTAEMYKNVIFDSQLRTGEIGFLSNIIENHDEPRGVSRYIPVEDLSEQSKKALAAVYFFLRGIPFIYQGQEIGMENCAFPDIAAYDDISTKDEYQVCLDAGCIEEKALELAHKFSRDNARTPVQWDDSDFAGFSTHEPWLMVNPNYKQINVKKQQAQPDSVWNFYKQMIAVYKNPAYHETLTFGKFEPYAREQKNLIAYHRKGESQTLLVLVNFQKEPQRVALPTGEAKVVLDNTASALQGISVKGSEITLDGYQAVVLEVM